MKRCLIYSARPLSGREGKNLLVHFRCLETRATKLDFLTNGKSTKDGDTIWNETGLSIQDVITQITTFYLNNEFTDWEDFYERVDVSWFERYDELFIMSGMDLHNSQLCRGAKREGVFPKDRGQIKFVSAGVRCANTLAMLKAHREYNIPLHEFAFDPNELSCCLFHEDYQPHKDLYNLYHCHTIEKYGIKRLDSAQYHYDSKPISFWPEEKKYDFTFGYTIMGNSNRETMQTEICEIAHSFEKWNLYYKKGEHDNLIPFDEYLTKLEQSRFTLVLPSYNEETFSLWRVIEAVQVDCLPIIHKDCKYDEVEKDFNIDFSQLVMNTSIDEKTRLELLEYLKDRLFKDIKLFQ